MNVRLFTKYVLIGIPLGFLFLAPAFALTNSKKLDVAVWIPYWRKDDGASTTLAHLDKITQVSPFAFELQNDGTIKNVLKIEEVPWTILIAEAKKRKIKIYPSILSYPKTQIEKQAVYALLSVKKKRQAHIKDIVTLVKKNKFDGIDIDYEAKVAEIKPHFSAFITELSIALHKEKKQLICTVEPRTPPESRYATTSKEVLSKVEYANDYKVIGRVCDQVRVMTYDQLGDDVQLVNQNTNNGALYRPVADIDWVEKVSTLMMRDIPAKKIILGVATYGYKYEIVPATATSSTKYLRIGSMNFNYADELAKSMKIIPTRNIAGEASIVYSTTTAVDGTPFGTTKQYLVWYSDATAIAQKVRLANLYKLGGVAIFKIDGGQDPLIWNIVP
jgi:spore germination protein YaaH